MYGVLYRFDLFDLGWFPSGPRARAAAYAFGAVLLWGLWPTLATFAHPAPPLQILALAAAVGFAVSFLSAAAQGRRSEFLVVQPRTLLFVAVALFANNILYLLAMPRIGPAEANVVAYLWPVMLVGLGALVGRSPLSVMQIGGIIIAFAGAAVVIGPRLDGDLDAFGYGLAFFSGLVFALYALVRAYGREANDVIGPSMGAIAILAAAGHACFETTASLDWKQAAAIAAIGIAPLSLSNMLWDHASRTGQLALVSAIAYFTPFAALMLLAVTGAAQVTIFTALGALLIVVGALAAANLIGRNEGSTE